LHFLLYEIIFGFKGATMNVRIITEIVSGYNFRLMYDKATQSFIEKSIEHYYALDESDFGIYGWIEGYGSPPNKHKDVIMITYSKPKLGEIIEGKLIGVFYRCDGDHKLICIDPNRNIDDLIDLESSEKRKLLSKYSGKYKGDAWLGKIDAISVLQKGVYMDRDSSDISNFDVLNV
jgi:hypothetical protein